MADRYKFQFTESFYGKTVLLDGYVKIGTAGAVLSGVAGQLNAAGNPALLPKGLHSVVRNSTGNYTLTFGLPNTQASVSGLDTYWDVSGVAITPVANAAAPAVEITANVASIALVAGTGAPGSVTQSVGSLIIQFQASGSAVDPPVNGGFFVLLKLQNSQVI